VYSNMETTPKATLEWIEVESGQVVSTQKLSEEEGDAAFGILAMRAFDGDRDSVAIGGADGIVRVFDRHQLKGAASNPPPDLRAQTSVLALDVLTDETGRWTALGSTNGDLALTRVDKVLAPSPSHISDPGDVGGGVGERTEKELTEENQQAESHVTEQVVSQTRIHLDGPISSLLLVVSSPCVAGSSSTPNRGRRVNVLVGAAQGYVAAVTWDVPPNTSTIDVNPKSEGSEPSATASALEDKTSNVTSAVGSSTPEVEPVPPLGTLSDVTILYPTTKSTSSPTSPGDPVTALALFDVTLDGSTDLVFGTACGWVRAVSLSPAFFSAAFLPAIPISRAAAASAGSASARVADGGRSVQEKTECVWSRQLLERVNAIHPFVSSTKGQRAVSTAVREGCVSEGLVTSEENKGGGKKPFGEGGGGAGGCHVCDGGSDNGDGAPSHQAETNQPPLSASRKAPLSLTIVTGGGVHLLEHGQESVAAKVARVAAVAVELAALRKADQIFRH
jgi:hypothetical protein